MIKNLVSIIIPTKNSGSTLENCLISIKRQTYKHIEVIIVDGKSKDIEVIKKLTNKYKCRLYTYVPRVKKGLFDATKKRNYAVNKAKGAYIYHFDADMELTAGVIKEAVELCIKGFDAVIIPEDSFGEGKWAKAKNLERRFFWGDDTVESPRFFKKSVWNELGGYDEDIAGGGDDRDIHQRILEHGNKVGRTKHMVMHNEGNLSLGYLLKKQFMYKREVLKYIRKRPSIAIQSYSPIRPSYFTNWRLFVSRPQDSVNLFIMKTVEIAAGLGGIIYSLFK